jgi:hypothetical protein
MLRRTRVSSTMDVGRLSQAVSRPGIDPRIWSSLAFVKAVNVDPDHGPLVDVQMMPSGGLGTARLATEYSGPGFGLYAPIAVDDEILVEAPSGDPAEGLVVVRRLWSASDPPPQEAIDTPDDVALVVQGGRDLRVHTSGGGENSSFSGIAHYIIAPSSHAVGCVSTRNFFVVLVGIHIPRNHNLVEVVKADGAFTLLSGPAQGRQQYRH